MNIPPLWELAGMERNEFRKLPFSERQVLERRYMGIKILSCCTITEIQRALRDPLKYLIDVFSEYEAKRKQEERTMTVLIEKKQRLMEELKQYRQRLSIADQPLEIETCAYNLMRLVERYHLEVHALISTPHECAYQEVSQ